MVVCFGMLLSLRFNTFISCAMYSFFYDFYVPDEQLSQGDLKKIKKEMDKIIKANYQIVKREVSRSEARSV